MRIRCINRKNCIICNEELTSNNCNIHISGKQKGKFYPYCKQCGSKKGSEWSKHNLEKRRKISHEKYGILPLNDKRSGGGYLGIYIAEKVLSKFFDNIKQMPYRNPGYDYICRNGFKIDVKSSTEHNNKKSKYNFWTFNILYNQIADYFLCLAFDNINNLNPLHIWLIPGKDINNKCRIDIYNNEHGLLKYKKYEKSLDKVIVCCNKMKQV
jgi:hypothetical protein